MYIPHLSKSNHVMLKCFTTVDGRFVRCKGVYDTGCQKTIFVAKDLGISLSDVGPTTARPIHGLFKDRSCNVYEYYLRDFAIGNVFLGPQNVCVIFDEYTTDNLIGYDILKQINRASIANSNQEILFKTEAELRAYFGNTSGILRALRFPQAKELRDYLLGFLTPASAEALGLTTDDEKLAYVLQTLNM